MNPRNAFPFRTLSDEMVCVESWLFGEKGKPLAPIERTLASWDYACDLETFAKISLDWGSTANHLGHPAGELQIRASLLCGTGSGSFPRRWDRIQSILMTTAHPQVELEGDLPGNIQSGRLLIRLQLTLEAPLDSDNILSPRMRGARLWARDQDILIEDGGDARFPVEAASFTRVFKGRPQQYAPWLLLWRRDSWHSDFSTSIRLYVNADHEGILERFQAGDPMLLQAMMGDAMSQVVEAVVLHDDAEAMLSGCNEGSVGRQAEEWMEMAFPGLILPEIKSLHQRDPGAFRASMLAAADVGSPGE